MANYAETATHVGLGVNSGHLALLEVELSQALASTDTATITVPSQYADAGYVPVAMACWTIAAPQLPVMQPHTANSLTMTSWNRTTGVLVCTAGSAGVADDSVITILLAKATLGTA